MADKVKVPAIKQLIPSSVEFSTRLTDFGPVRDARAGGTYGDIFNITLHSNNVKGKGRGLHGRFVYKEFKVGKTGKAEKDIDITKSLRELEFLSAVTHEHIVYVDNVNLKMNAVDKNGIRFNFGYVMPLFELGSLSDVLEDHTLYPDLPWALRKEMARQIAEAIDYLHNGLPSCVLHRDLKGPNCLVKVLDVARGKVHLVLSDFGTVSVQMNERSKESTGGIKGTPQWSSPQRFKTKVIEKRRCTVPHDKPDDVFSFGIVMFELLSRKGPWAQKVDGVTVLDDACVRVALGVHFKYDHDKFLKNAVKDEAYQWDKWRRKNPLEDRRPDVTQVDDGCPEELVHLMQGCWEDRGHDRPQIEKILARLTSHPDAHPDEPSENKSESKATDTNERNGKSSLSCGVADTTASATADAAMDAATDATDDVDWTLPEDPSALSDPPWLIKVSRKSSSLSTEPEGKGDDGEGPVAVELSPSVVLGISYRKKSAIRKATQGASKGKWEMTVEVPAQSVKGFETLTRKMTQGIFVNKLKKDHGLTWFQVRWQTKMWRRLTSGKRVEVHEVYVVANASMTKREARVALDAAYKSISDQVQACDQDYQERQKQQSVLAAAAEATSARHAREVEVDDAGINIRVVPPHRLPEEHRGYSVPSARYHLCKSGFDCHHGTNCFFATNVNELERWNRILCDDESKTATIRPMNVHIAMSPSFTGEFIPCRVKIADGSCPYGKHCVFAHSRDECDAWNLALTELYMEQQQGPERVNKLYRENEESFVGSTCGGVGGGGSSFVGGTNDSSRGGGFGGERGNDGSSHAGFSVDEQDLAWVEGHPDQQAVTAALEESGNDDGPKDGAAGGGGQSKLWGDSWDLFTGIPPSEKRA
jgi:serine/threonine protein kinase